ncbi:protein of unknown function DUF548 [Ammonifex degensii KC4]|uniref:SAM-dependent methyltransferase n=1 Tax=Ammonifex degensii (strain DSM 10501 / KC4) TaxID=429009 RepID=C9R9M4_AMMDK|nr:class I SAM-dependent methyltransferase [Ammonifex degensii]ACX53003.1 protein of unknown function DUF548 [Ammonifex degensii KC4]
MKLVVTTSYQPTPDQEEKAHDWARLLGVEYVPRRRESLKKIATACGAEGVLVVRQEGPVLVGEGGEELFFHPGTALLRLRNLWQGKGDPLIEAMALTPGESVLDCTLGLGSEALVVSFFLGPSGRVVGVEKVPVIALLVREGLKALASSSSPLAEAASRIEVVVADHLDYLKALPEESFDVVYFDPFFQQPVKAAVNLAPLRYFGSREALRPEAIKEALRVARRRVVLKERKGSAEFARLGFREIIAGRQARVAYGVIVKR